MGTLVKVVKTTFNELGGTSAESCVYITHKFGVGGLSYGSDDESVFRVDVLTHLRKLTMEILPFLLN